METPSTLWTETRPKDEPAQVRCKECDWQGEHARQEFSSTDPGHIDSYCPACGSGRLKLVWKVPRPTTDVTASQELRDLVALWRARLAVLDPRDHDHGHEIEILTACTEALEERIGK